MQPTRLFSYAVLLCVLSGAAALGHELLWTRRLVDLLGGTSEATARVLGCFFLGLAVGNAIAARLVPRLKNAWRAVGLVELAIGAATLPVVTLPLWTDWLWPTLGPERLVGWEGGAIKTAISALVVMPPSLLMGMTLPFFVAAVLHGTATLAKHGIWLYAANTLGGVIGLAVASGTLLERLGVTGTMFVAIGANGVVAGVALLLGRRPVPARTRDVRGGKRATGKSRREVGTVVAEPPRFATVLTLAAFSGFVVLGLEVLAIRLLNMIVPSSFQATTSVLIAVILTLAVAAAVTPLVFRWFAAPRILLVLVLSICGVATALCPTILFHRTEQLIDVSSLAASHGESFTTTAQFTVAVFEVAILSVGPALLIGGMVLPMTLAWMGQSGGDPHGVKLGYVLAANGVGGLLGTEMVSRVVLPAVGIYQGFTVLGVLYAVAAVVLHGTRSRRPALVLPTGAMAVVGWLAMSELARMPYISPRTTTKFDVLATDFGREGVLLVTDTDTRGKGILLNNQYVLGSTGGVRDERRQVLLPMILHPNPREVCCLGLATGISAGAALDYVPACEVTAIEISPLVAAAAERDFAAENRAIFRSENARVVIEDARTYAAACRNRFDVIVGDLYRPYGSGEGRLYSVEHFRAVRAALRKDGIFCQWLPMYQLTVGQFEIIVRTFIEIFPEAELIRGNHSARLPILALVGCKSGRLDLSHVSERCELLRQHGGIDDEELLSASGIESLYVGRLDSQVVEDAPVNTLNNAIVEILAGRTRVLRAPRLRETEHEPEQAYLVGEQWTEFEGQFARYVEAGN